MVNQIFSGIRRKSIDDHTRVTTQLQLAPISSMTLVIQVIQLDLIQLLPMHAATVNVADDS